MVQDAVNIARARFMRTDGGARQRKRVTKILTHRATDALTLLSDLQTSLYTVSVSSFEGVCRHNGPSKGVVDTRCQKVTKVGREKKKQLMAGVRHDVKSDVAR